MKDGRTRLAHKAEHAVDLETGAVVGVSVQDADAGDTQTMLETLVTAAEQVDAVLPAGPGIAELVCDKGYHSNQTLVTLAEVEIRSYVSEPDRGRRNWRGKHVARDAVYANRRRIRGARGKRLLRRRGERLERPHAHLCQVPALPSCQHGLRLSGCQARSAATPEEALPAGPSGWQSCSFVRSASISALWPSQSAKCAIVRARSIRSSSEQFLARQSETAKMRASSESTTSAHVKTLRQTSDSGREPSGRPSRATQSIVR